LFIGWKRGSFGCCMPARIARPARKMYRGSEVRSSDYEWDRVYAGDATLDANGALTNVVASPD
jgi:hypothetical protein